MVDWPRYSLVKPLWLIIAAKCRVEKSGGQEPEDEGFSSLDSLYPTLNKNSILSAKYQEFKETMYNYSSRYKWL